MPVLPTYTSQVQAGGISGGRRASGADFAAPIGDISKSINTAVNSYTNDLEDSEARKALIASAEIKAKYAKALDVAATSGGDLEALKAQMTDEFGKVSENFQTKRGHDSVQLYTANTSLMFDEQANSIAVRRAAAEARLAGSKFINSAGAIIQSNPLYLPSAEKDAEALVSTFGRISPEQKAEITNSLKKELNMAAAIASARIDPKGTKDKLDGGAWDLTPEQRSAAINKADTEIRAMRADESYQRAEKEYQARKADEDARDSLFKGIMGGKATRRDIMDNPDLRPTTREHLIMFMEERAKSLTNQEKKSDPRAVRDLWMAIHAPDTDPNKIYNGDAIFQAVQAGRVNVSDANQLNTLVANQKDENNRSIGSKLQSQMSIVGRALSQDPKYIGRPALVAEIQTAYQARVFERVGELRGAKQNPSDVFDPGSKNYVGSREFIQGAIDEVTGRASGALSAPKVNTQAEYDALPPGAHYTDSSGNPAVKKGTAPPKPAPAPKVTAPAVAPAAVKAAVVKNIEQALVESSFPTPSGMVGGAKALASDIADSIDWAKYGMPGAKPKGK
jgi:hypothetical protein